MTPRFAKQADEVEDEQIMNGEEQADESSFERFRKLVKRVVSVPKSEIDKRAEEWKAAREAKSEESEE